MKKVFRNLALLLAFLVSLTACGSPSDQGEEKGDNNATGIGTSESSSGKSSGKIKVAATFFPIYDFTIRIAGDQADVFCITPEDQDAHDWEPKAQDISNLEDCDLIIKNGVGMENWLDDVLASLSEEKNVVDTSEGIDLIKADEEDLDKDDGHEEGSDHHHKHGEYDPHIWLSLRNAIVQMENIKDALVEADPENKEVYEKNFQEAKKEFSDLYEDTEEKIGEKGGAIVVPHKAFSYLCRDYNLTQIPVEGMLTEGDPSPQEMSEIIEEIKDKKIKTIFYEAENEDHKLLDQIADEAGCELAPISSIEFKSPESEEDYLNIMKKNLEGIERAVK